VARWRAGASLEWLAASAASRIASAASRICTDPYHPGKIELAYVIAEPCVGTKDNSCVEVCPVDCIHPTPDEPGYDDVEMLYIDPEECIDCDACVEACPVDACFAEDQLPDEWQKYIQINAEYYNSGGSAAAAAG
jgi:ferredoxin